MASCLIPRLCIVPFFHQLFSAANTPPVIRKAHDLGPALQNEAVDEGMH